MFIVFHLLIFSFSLFFSKSCISEIFVVCANYFQVSKLKTTWLLSISIQNIIKRKKSHRWDSSESKWKANGTEFNTMIIALLLLWLLWTWSSKWPPNRDTTWYKRSIPIWILCILSGTNQKTRSRREEGERKKAEKQNEKRDWV